VSDHDIDHEKVREMLRQNLFDWYAEAQKGYVLRAAADAAALERVRALTEEYGRRAREAREETGE
jgi:hypothetical protein